MARSSELCCIARQKTTFEDDPMATKRNCGHCYFLSYPIPFLHSHKLKLWLCSRELVIWVVSIENDCLHH